MATTYSKLSESAHGEVLRQGTILCIAAASRYAAGEDFPVKMTELQWGERPSFEFPLLLEALIEAEMLEHNWAV